MTMTDYDTTIIEVPITDMHALAQQVIECEKSAQRNREFLFNHVVELDTVVEIHIRRLEAVIKAESRKLTYILSLVLISNAAIMSLILIK